jgi:DNA-directed RNA polymerase I, II, and III subunit RPABC5
MSCGNVIADKWNYYKTQLLKLKGTDQRLYIDGTQIPETVEKQLMDRLGFKRNCCRKHVLTHVDLLEKI